MNNLKKHIWLCGFMGCGKSTIGALLAKRYGAGFIDLDHYIEKKEHKTINDIFSQSGEKGFREIESACIREFLEVAPSVIATGGGAMVSDANAAEARRSGIIVFLNVPFTTCYQRIASSERPIVKRSTPDELYELYQKRYPFYQAHADISFDETLPPLQSAENLQHKIAAFL